MPVLCQVQAAGPRVVSVEPMTGAMDITRWLPRVAGPWQGTPPKTWAEVVWPEWVPAEVREQIASFWAESSGRSPGHYQASIRGNCYDDIPNFGTRGRFHRVCTRDQWVEGRYIHAWNNIGRVVLDDGTYECVSIGSMKPAAPSERASAPGHGWQISTLGWVIAGGESGPKARPSHPDWFRALRDQCVAAGVPFFMKQHGEFAEVNPDARDPVTGGPVTRDPEDSDDAATFILGLSVGIAPDGRVARSLDAMEEGVPYRHMTRLGKKAAGRLLDGRTWDEVPDVG